MKIYVMERRIFRATLRMLDGTIFCTKVEWFTLKERRDSLLHPPHPPTPPVVLEQKIVKDEIEL